MQRLESCTVHVYASVQAGSVSSLVQPGSNGDTKIGSCLHRASQIYREHNSYKFNKLHFFSLTIHSKNECSLDAGWQNKKYCFSFIISHNINQGCIYRGKEAIDPQHFSNVNSACFIKYCMERIHANIMHI